MKKISFIVTSFLLVTTCALAQHAMLENMIDPFTGNVSYSRNLLTVTGPNGENFPLSINYGSGGIYVDQKASMTGLGWSINTGEISREVQGIPDDWRGTTKNLYDQHNGNRSINFYGPVWFADYPAKTNVADYNVNDEMDVFTSERKLDNNTFVGINYDNYYLNTPVFGAELEMRLFDYASLMGAKSDVDMQDFNWTGSLYDYQEEMFQKSPLLFMKGMKGIDIKPYLGGEQMEGYNLTETGMTYAEWRLENFDHTKTGSSRGYIGDIEPNGKIINGYYIKYFTNSEINNIRTLNAYTSWNYIESNLYHGVNRSNDNIIGAIQVTTPTGMTYHFSLPEYVYMESSYSMEVDANGDGSTLYSSSELANTSIPSYARNWKLVAITGPDFVDNGIIGKIDDADKGYWISIEHGKIYSRKKTRSPYYGLKPDTDIPGGQIQDIQAYESEFEPNKYKSTGNLQLEVSENYYTSTISTATRAALFAYSTRDDDFGLAISGSLKLPELKLDKIILVNKDDLDNILALTSAPSYNSSIYESGEVNFTNLYGSNFNSSYTNYVLGGSSFSYDYELANNYYQNVNANIATTDYPTSGTLKLYDKVTGATSVANSGKLTLKSIQSLYKNAVVDEDPTNFVYNSLNNPDYNPHKQDYWGFYKSDQNGFYDKYTTDISKDKVDAWLLKEIDLPNGSRISVEYEADNYTKVGNVGPEQVDEQTVQRTFLVTSISHVNTTGTSPDRNIELELTLDGNLPPSFINNTISRQMSAFVRYNGKCRSNYYHDGTSGINHNVFINSNPAVGMGFTGYLTSAPQGVDYTFKGKMHHNILEGEMNFKAASNTTTYGTNLLDIEEIPGFPNKLRVTFKEPEIFNSLFFKATSLNSAMAGSEYIEYWNCTPNSTTASYYPYGTSNNEFLSGYISVNIPATAYGGGVRVSNVTLDNLDNNETFSAHMDYGFGRATAEPDRFAPIVWQEDDIFGKPGYWAHTQFHLPKVLYRSPIGSDPLIQSPMVYYPSPKVILKSNGENLKTKTYRYKVGMDIIDATNIVSKVDPEGKQISAGGGCYRIWARSYNYAHIIDHRNLFGKPNSIKISGAEGSITKTFKYREASSYMEWYTKRNTSSLETTNGYGHGVCLTSNGVEKIFLSEYLNGLEVKNYELYEIEEKIEPEGIVITTQHNQYDRIADTYLESKAIHNVLGTVQHNQKFPAYLTNVDFESKNTNTSSKNLSATIERTVNLIEDKEARQTFTTIIPELSKDIATGRFKINNGNQNTPMTGISSYRNGADQAWINQSRINLLNVDQNVLEVQDMPSGVRSSIHYQLSNSKTLCESSNASYYSAWFETFEEIDFNNTTSSYMLPSGLTAHDVVLDNTFIPHSGNSSIRLEPNGYLQYYLDATTNNSSSYTEDILHAGKQYIIQFWVEKDFYNDIEVNIGLNGSLSNGNPYTSNITKNITGFEAVNGEWGMVRMTFEVPEGFSFDQAAQNINLTIVNEGSTDIHIDDVSLRPEDASIMAYVYDSFTTQPTYMFGSDNKYIRTEYDIKGRPIRIYKETATGEELIKSNTYYYEKY